jgi:hypothetical protein
MDLLAFRELFRKLSGQFSLVDGEDFSDNGADIYINEGSKHLDRRTTTQKSFASCFRFVPVDHISATFPYCRATKEVWIHTSNARWQLEKKPLADLIAQYLTGLPSSRDSGQPNYYTPTITRYVPHDIDAGDFEAWAGFVDIPAAPDSDYNSILLSCPVDEVMSVEIKGLFYSPYLSEDTDSNYWTDVHPLLLVASAMRQIEIINRNTQGVNDWDRAIATQATDINMDFIEEVISEINQMRG